MHRTIECTYNHIDKFSDFTPDFDLLSSSDPIFSSPVRRTESYSDTPGVSVSVSVKMLKFLMQVIFSFLMCLSTTLFFIRPICILLRILARPACDRPRGSNGDRVTHGNGQFSRDPLGTTAKELVTGGGLTSPQPSPHSTRAK